MKQPIHVGIPNPTENQKIIIESAISLVEIYKHMINIKKIRREKLKQRKALNNSFKELKTLINQIELPETQEYEEHKKIIKPKKPEKIPEPKDEPKKQSKLDKELQELKRKLKKIQ